MRWIFSSVGNTKYMAGTSGIASRSESSCLQTQNNVTQDMTTSKKFESWGAVPFGDTAN